MWKMSILSVSAAILFISGPLFMPASLTRVQGEQGKEDKGKEGEKKKGVLKKYRSMTSIANLWIDGEPAGANHFVTNNDADFRIATGKELGDTHASNVWLQIVEGTPGSLEDLPPTTATEATLQTGNDTTRFWVKNGVSVSSDVSTGRLYTMIVWVKYRKESGDNVEVLYQRTQHSFNAITFSATTTETKQ
jgi:hypothetical protein